MASLPWMACTRRQRGFKRVSEYASMARKEQSPSWLTATMLTFIKSPGRTRAVRQGDSRPCGARRRGAWGMRDRERMAGRYRPGADVGVPAGQGERPEVSAFRLCVLPSQEPLVEGSLFGGIEPKATCRKAGSVRRLLRLALRPL